MDNACADDSENAEKLMRMLLDRSRASIASGDGEQALAALIHAISLNGGEEAVMQVLSEARSRASRELEERRMQDEANTNREVLEMAMVATERLMTESSLLSDRGDEELLRDAFEDGSSVICKFCGGLVKASRWESHREFWCEGVSETAQSTNQAT